MTITREQLEKAAKAAGIRYHFDNSVVRLNGIDYPCLLILPDLVAVWTPLADRGQLLDLAMACRICIDPQLNQIKWLNQAKWDMGDGYAVRHQYVDCQDFPALAEAVILAACEQFDAKGGSGG